MKKEDIEKLRGLQDQYIMAWMRLMNALDRGTKRKIPIEKL